MSAPDTPPPLHLQEFAFPELFRDEVIHLESARLWLRWPRLADAACLQEIAALEAVARHTATWPHPLPDGEAARRIERARAANTAGTGLVLALAEKSRPGRLIGLIGLTPDTGGPGHVPGLLEIGCMLGVQHHGLGLMTEAVRVLVDAVFRFSAAGTIRGASGLANIASRKVMQKAGFQPIGQSTHLVPARGGAVPCEQFELTRGIWRGRRNLQATPIATTQSGVQCSACAA